MNTPHEKDLRILDQVAAVCRPQDASALRRIGDRLVELENLQPVPDGWRTELKQIADTLDLDGDEYGCAARIFKLLKHEPVPAPAVPDVDAMVGAFLSWRLPDDFAPDAGISFDPVFNKGTQWEMRHEPFGTNLLNYDQAKAMVLHMLANAPQPPTATDPRDEQIAELRRQVFSYESMVADRDELLARRDLDAERWKFARCWLTREVVARWPFGYRPDQFENSEIDEAIDRAMRKDGV